MAITNHKSKVADCEVCDKTTIEVWLMHGNIWMCLSCRDTEQKLVIEESREIDSKIELKTDIFAAKTVAAVELRGAIEADESIPQDQKEYVYAKECLIRFKHMQQVIFEDRLALQEKENEARMWQVNVQNSAGKLRTELRAQFKELDVNYQPTPITKQVKTTKPVKEGKKFNKAELYAAAKKYGFPAQLIQRIVLVKNLSPEDACKHLQSLAAGEPV